MLLSNEEKIRLGKWLEQHCSMLMSEDVEVFKEYVIELLSGGDGRGDVDGKNEGNERWFVDSNSFRTGLERYLTGVVENVPEFLDDLYDVVKSKSYMPQKRTPLVLVKNVPRSKLERGEIRRNFEPFGAIRCCQVNMEDRALLIEFKNPFCAIRCTKAATRFFENRFVKLQLFERPSQFEGCVLDLYGSKGSDSPKIVERSAELDLEPLRQPSLGETSVSNGESVQPSVSPDPPGSDEAKVRLNGLVEEVQTLQQPSVEERSASNAALAQPSVSPDPPGSDEAKVRLNRPVEEVQTLQQPALEETSDQNAAPLPPRVSPDPPGSENAKVRFNRRVEEVQTLQQTLFEERQRKNKKYQEQLNQLLHSKERLLRAHQSMLDELATRIDALATDDNDNDDKLLGFASEFESIQESMNRLEIMPSDMIKHKLEMFTLENPASSLMLKNARLQRIKSKRSRKSSILKKRARRKK